MKEMINPTEVHIHIHEGEEDLVTVIKHLEKIVMTGIADVQAKVNDLIESVAKETSADNSILTLVTGLSTLIGSLKQQLADAIAAGNDPATLQAVLTSLQSAQETINANAARITDAVTTTPTT